MCYRVPQHSYDVIPFLPANDLLLIPQAIDGHGAVHMRETRIPIVLFFYMTTGIEYILAWNALLHALNYSDGDIRAQDNKIPFFR